MPLYGMILGAGGVLLLLCCCALLLIRALLIVVIVQGQSMSPTLEEGDRVLVVRPLWQRWIHRGQIVLFRQTDLVEEPDDPLSLHIKRVVVLAGEQYRSSTPPLGYSEHVAQEGQEYLWRIPQDHLFVCGDNREQSIDSRSWGPLPLRNVRGIVVKRLASSPTSYSAHVAIVQRRISNETPDRFHAECY